MRIFEFPYIIITIFVFCFLVLGAVGVYFALQGVKATKKTIGIDFLNVNQLENRFIKSGKLRKSRCVTYISVSLDNARSLYSDSKARSIFEMIKPMLLKEFSLDENSGIAQYDNQNFIAFGCYDKETAVKNIEQSSAEISKCLSKNNVINSVEIRFGFYCAFATQIDFDEAITRARQACVMAETDGVCYVEWNSKSGKALEKRIKIENNIEKEIDNNRFFLEYQPVLEASTKKIVGAEVLSRLNSENEGVLSPGSFLSAVNSVGISDKFDYYIFEKNCKWISNNKERRERYVYTINFSRTTICDPMFSERIIDITEKYGVKYSSIALEVLEDKEVSKNEREQMLNNLLKLKEKGVKILLDDFGSGYTSFGDLQTLSIDTVKIDKSITQASDTEAGLLIMKNIVRTANELGFKTVCEGIETEEHEKRAIEAGCDFLQGFYYYRPMPVVQLEQLFIEEENK